MQILLTHLHLDHIQGLLFFGPLFDPTSEITVSGHPRRVRTSTSGWRATSRRRCPRSTCTSSPPASSSPPCPRGEWQVGGARIEAAIVAHRGVTLGYRITEGESTLCYLPDHEPALGTSLADADAGWISGSGLADGATALIHDAQYRDDEYPSYVGWGHSRVSDTVAFASRANAQRLILFHHDPGHDDAMLDEIGQEARESWDHAGRDPATLSLAAEGTTLTL